MERKLPKKIYSQEIKRLTTGRVLQTLCRKTYKEVELKGCDNMDINLLKMAIGKKVMLKVLSKKHNKVFYFNGTAESFTYGSFLNVINLKTNYPESFINETGINVERILEAKILSTAS